jgi:hypothetical protein
MGEVEKIKYKKNIDHIIFKIDHNNQTDEQTKSNSLFANLLLELKEYPFMNNEELNIQKKNEIKEVEDKELKIKPIKSKNYEKLIKNYESKKKETKFEQKMIQSNIKGIYYYIKKETLKRLESKGIF